MILPHTCRRNLKESRVRAQLFDSFRATITHTSPQAADQLIQKLVQFAFVGHAPFNALRHQLAVASTIVVRLSIAFARAMNHRPERPHPSISFVGSSLIQHSLARAFVQAGEQATHHDEVSPGGNRLGNISGVTNSTVGNDRCRLIPWLPPPRCKPL